MARFPIDDSKLPEIGKALARAVTDPEARNSYLSDPKAYLIAAGVDESAIKDLHFSVVEDSASNLNLVIPSAINRQKLDAGDEQYLIDLGRSVILSCGY